jgi:secreted trypsin-like serine protease
MLKLPSLAAAAVFTALLAAAPPAAAIVGGAPAPAGRWPWMVALLKTHAPNAFVGQFCGGTVIAPRRVLTAAHCIEDTSAKRILVLVGRERLTAHGGRRIAVTHIHEFPAWAHDKAPGLDAAVLTLAADAGVAPVTLARPGQDAAWAGGTAAWTLGWGRLNGASSPGGSSYYADRLRELALPIAGDDACEGVYGGGNGDLVYRPEWSVCAGAADGHTGTCYGDSGGPLVVGSDGAWLQVGVLTGADDCAPLGYYDLYARVDRVSAFALGPLRGPGS